MRLLLLAVSSAALSGCSWMGHMSDAEYYQYGHGTYAGGGSGCDVVSYEPVKPGCWTEVMAQDSYQSVAYADMPAYEPQVQSVPVASMPVQSIPVQSIPVQSAPVQSYPVQTHVQSYPVQTQVQSHTVQSYPVQTYAPAPVQRSVQTHVPAPVQSYETVRTHDCQAAPMMQYQAPMPAYQPIQTTPCHKVSHSQSYTQPSHQGSTYDNPDYVHPYGSSQSGYSGRYGSLR